MTKIIRWLEILNNFKVFSKAKQSKTKQSKAKQTKQSKAKFIFKQCSSSNLYTRQIVAKLKPVTLIQLLTYIRYDTNSSSILSNFPTNCYFRHSNIFSKIRIPQNNISDLQKYWNMAFTFLCFSLSCLVLESLVESKPKY